MALSKKIEYRPSWLSSPLVVEDAYCKVIHVAGNKSTIECTVAVFENEKSAAPIYSNKYMFAPNLDDNFIKQAYKHLKTLEEFANAKDC